jgi:hypothetical protein
VFKKNLSEKRMGKFSELCENLKANLLPSKALILIKVYFTAIKKVKDYLFCLKQKFSTMLINWLPFIMTVIAYITLMGHVFDIYQILGVINDISLQITYQVKVFHSKLVLLNKFFLSASVFKKQVLASMESFRDLSVVYDSLAQNIEKV